MNKTILVIDDSESMRAVVRLDGISFVKHLKTTRHKFVPVVMLTTSTQESQKAECRAAGVRVWVTKPFQPSDLIRAVTTVCGAASASSI